MQGASHRPFAASWSSVLVLGLVGQFLPSQTVWTVTTPLGIQAAINAANPGDVIELLSSTSGVSYAPFTLDKGLTIRGNGARVGYLPIHPQFTIDVDVPVGQVAHFVDVDCRYSYSPLGNLGCGVRVQGGSVRFDRCQLARGNGPALEIDDAHVVMLFGAVTGLTNVGAGPAIVANNSHIELRDFGIYGAGSVCHPIIGCQTGFSAAAPGAILTGSTLHAERSTFVGGDHNHPALAGGGADAVQATGSTLWLADCTLTGGTGGSAAGAALVNNGAVPATLWHCTLNGASSGLIDATTPLLQLEQSAPWTRGVTVTLTTRGPAGAAHGLLLAPDLASSASPFVTERVWITGGAAIAVGILDPTGIATFPVVVPNVPQLQDATVWCQAITPGATGFPLRASAIAGGVIR